MGGGEESSVGCDPVQVTATCFEHQLCARAWGRLCVAVVGAQRRSPNATCRRGSSGWDGLFLPLLISEPQVGPSPSGSVQTRSQQRLP